MIEPRFFIIAALDRNGIIGRDGRMPWHIREDLAWFQIQSLVLLVIMGRKTWLSLSKALVGRENIVLSRDPDFSPSGAIVVRNLSELIAFCGSEDCFVIGGAQIYRLFLDRASRLYLTTIGAEFEGDTCFPAIDKSDWRLIYRRYLRSRQGYKLRFTISERIPK
ncbi:MAG: dihydrofolate reductase [Candidatus Cloacimonadota bacterium]|nr:dihydrofolate reductase [Candidatus Cloacimonadota bacterium]